MAKVVAKIVGGSSKDLEASTVGDVKRQLGVPGYQANVNGSPAADTATLSEDSFITLSPAVKGGRN
jgi:hypothetical protein